MNNIKKRTDIKDGGIFTADFYSLTKTNKPAIFISVGYLSNEAEAKKINNRVFQYQFASGIYNGIIEYYIFA
jgi:N-acetylmuramoyl-L-alanine amidase